MADVSVKMGVSGIGQFTQGISQAQASVKSFDSALKLNEKQLKATGDAETYLQNKTQSLQGKINAYKSVIANAEKAMKQMKDNGVSPLDTSYQKMQRTMLDAQSGLLDAQQEMEGVGSAAAEASGKVDELSGSLGGINKKISLQQVIDSIDKITGALESAGKKAVEVGKQIWDNILDAAQWSDDTATMASILGMDVEEYQRYKGVFDTVGDITVAEWQKMKTKVQKLINDPSSDQIDIMAALGISTQTTEWPAWVGNETKGFEEMFWEIGQTLREKVESGELTQDLADTYANAIFGKSFAELNPLLDLGEEAFNEALQEQTVASEEAVEANAALNDKLTELQNSFNALKVEVLSGLAPALTSAAEVLNSLLGKLMEYLQTDEGQKALESMEQAVSGLFSDLSKIDPEEVVSGFAEVFNGIVSGLQWLSENSGTVISAMEAIVVGWAGLKLTGGILQIANLISGITGLGAGTATESAASTAGKTAGTAWGGAFAAAVIKAAPWLAGVYTLLNPSDGSDSLGDNDLWDEHGNPTAEAQAQGITWTQEEDSEEHEPTVPMQHQLEDDSTGTAEEMQAQIDLKKQLGAEEPIELSGTNTYTLPVEPEITEPAEEDIPTIPIPVEPEVEDEAELEQLLQDTEAQLNPTIPENTDETLSEEIGTVEADTHMQAQEGSAKDLADQVGVVTVSAAMSLTRIIFGTGGGGVNLNMKHANGLPYVPFDGYPAILHKGERVMTARENSSSRSYNSNLYVESMYMNNGTDANGLAAAMAAATRRTMSGYGS